MPPPAPGRTARALAALDRQAGRPWFLPAVALFPLADYLLPFLPNQLLLATLALLHPARWWQFALLFAGAAGLATLGIAAAIQAIGPALVDALLGGAPAPAAAERVLALVRRWGLAAVMLLSLLPWTPRAAVIVCALAGLPPPGLALAVTLGRLLPAGLIAGAGALAPALLRRQPRIAALLLAVEAERRRAAAPQAQRTQG